jgi:hypothetical protein
MMGPAARWALETTCFKSNQYVSKQGPKFNSSQISDFLKLIASDKSGRTSGAMPTRRLLTPGFWLLAPETDY